MKNSELKKLVSEYKKLKLDKRNSSHSRNLSEKLAEIRHRYFHETGNDLESDLKSNSGDAV